MNGSKTPTYWLGAREERRGGGREGGDRGTLGNTGAGRGRGGGTRGRENREGSGHKE